MSNGKISNKKFEIKYTDSGLSSIRLPDDKFDTNYVAQRNTFGDVLVRYRSRTDKGWKDLRVASCCRDRTESAKGKSVEFAIQPVVKPFLSGVSISVSEGKGYTGALNDLSKQESSNDHATAHFAWWPKRGTKEWVQYTFPKEVLVSAVEAYWFEDAPTGGACKLPTSWRLLYEDGEDWREVRNPSGYGVGKDAYQRCAFDPVKTSALRLEAQFQEGFCAGLHEWRVECDEDGRIEELRREKIEASAKEIEVVSGFRLERDVMFWSVTLRNTSNAFLEVGDLAIPLRFNTKYHGEKQLKYTQGLVRHTYVSGHGSFSFWMRANGIGPFLTMVPQGKAKFECFDLACEDEHVDTVFVHSAAKGEWIEEKGSNWRLPHTGLMLTPNGSPGSEVVYEFKFTWASDLEDVREILYREGKFDTHVVPGMTIPVDLPARFSFRTKNPIESVVVEHPDKTEIADLWKGKFKRGFKDTHVYEVKFSKLGENLVTINYEDGKYTTLEFFVTEPLETVIKKRSAFLMNTQQHRNPSKWYNGLVCDWDMQNRVLRNPEDNTDGFNGWWNYVLTCDDPGLCKVPYMASKNVVHPDRKEIEAVEYYLKNFVWGGLQCTDREKYPYAVYGVPNWKVDRESEFDDNRGKAHIWRIYDYPHIILLYYAMYRIAKMYPKTVKYLDKIGYLKRAYHTGMAWFTYPEQIVKWEPYHTGTYNELIVNDLLDSLVAEGLTEEAGNLRKHWERKVENFINNDLDLYGSEYAFDSTGFESTHAFVKYSTQQLAVPGRTLQVTQESLDKFNEEQMRLNITVRGWLETSYFFLGSDYRGAGSFFYTLSYMAQMGGWAVMDYGLYYAKDPVPYLRLGYNSYLSSWALVNCGTPESNYGYWFAGKENDGGAGGGFEPAPYTKCWLGKQQVRGSWNYGCEIDLGFSGGLRTAATVLVDDPIFGLSAYGGLVKKRKMGVEVIPRDGLRIRFHDMRGTNRFHLSLNRDGFAEERPITIIGNLEKVCFMLENRTEDQHTTGIQLSGLPAGKYKVTVGTKEVTELDTDGAKPVAVEIPVSGRKLCNVAVDKVQ